MKTFWLTGFCCYAFFTKSLVSKQLWSKVFVFFLYVQRGSKGLRINYYQFY